jgi:hypothetical protein
MLISLPILRGNGAHLTRKKDVWKKNHNYFEHAKELLKYHQFASSFEQWNFTNNGSLKETKIDNPNYFASLMIFQRYKIAREDCLPW